MDIFYRIIALIKIAYYGLLSTFQEFKYRHFEQRISLPEEEENVEGQVVVITGASRGIGKAAAKELARRKAIVVLGCIDMKEGEDACNEIKKETGNKNIDLIYLDLSDMDLVEKFALDVAKQYPKIKILINNAGLGFGYGDWAKKKTREGFNLHVAVNHLGHFLLANLLLENLKAAGAARVVSMSSTMQLLSNLDLDDIMMEKPYFTDTLSYCNTKFQNALFIKELGQRTQNGSVNTYGLCPGSVRTSIWDPVPSSGFAANLTALALKFHGFSPDEAAAESVMYCTLNKSIAKETGFMYRYRKHFDAANERLDPDICQRLWDISSELVKLDERLQRFDSKKRD